MVNLVCYGGTSRKYGDAGRTCHQYVISFLSHFVTSM